MEFNLADIVEDLVSVTQVQADQKNLPIQVSGLERREPNYPE